MRPRLLDLFCGAGGAAVGYHRAGFDVVGVDIKPQPNYPFAFVKSDALEWVQRVDIMEGHRWLRSQFDAIHASPPCQFASPASRITPRDDPHSNLIPQTRELLESTGLPYVIENVEAAKEHLIDPVLICGSMFDPPMEIKRHRLFEANWQLEDPVWPCRHRVWYPRYPVTKSHERRSPQGDLSTVVWINGSSGHMGVGGADLWRRVMDMPWATSAEIVQAIPPAYTEFIGTQLMAHLERVAA